MERASSASTTRRPNNQMFPSIAMDAAGAFVISWTSYGQDGDARVRKQYLREAVRIATTICAATNTFATQADATLNFANPNDFGVVMTTTDDPANHIRDAGGGVMDGVVQLIVQRSDLAAGYVGLGTGSLLLDGNHILTAAHVVCDNLGNMVATSVDVVFDMADGYVTVPGLVSQIYVNPQYNGTPWVSGGDLAIITLATSAPAAAERYDIARQSDAINQIFTKVGYGNSGTGDTGVTIPAEPYGPKRSGQNRYEATAAIAR